jgi:hypothetical protein
MNLGAPTRWFAQSGLAIFTALCINEVIDEYEKILGLPPVHRT